MNAPVGSNRVRDQLDGTKDLRRFIGRRGGDVPIEPVADQRWESVGICAPKRDDYFRCSTGIRLDEDARAETCARSGTERSSLGSQPETEMKVRLDGR